MVEWDYGDYEGLTTPQIREKVPNWTIFSHGAQGGESVDEVGERADRVLHRLEGENILLFSSGHFSRVLGARWLGFGAEEGRYLLLNTASVSILGINRGQHVIELWNEIHFLPRI